MRVGTRPHLKRIKLQLWDTAGTERFRSVSRSYYRGAAGAVLVYDVSSFAAFAALPTFLRDARALASPCLNVLLAGNKIDVVEEHAATEFGRDSAAPATAVSASESGTTMSIPLPPLLSTPSTPSQSRPQPDGSTRTATANFRSHSTFAPEGREVSIDTASSWAGEVGIPVSVEVSALSGENVEELFHRLAAAILTRIEVGEIDPNDPASGVQYGDSGAWGAWEDGSVRSGVGAGGDDGMRRRKKRSRGAGVSSSLREWEEVFRLPSRRRGNCC